MGDLEVGYGGQGGVSARCQDLIELPDLPFIDLLSELAHTAVEASVEGTEESPFDLLR